MSDAERRDDDQKEAIIRHETQLKDYSVRLGNLETKTDVILTELHKVNAAIAGWTARPAFSLSTALDATVKVGWIAGLMVGGIIYVTQASFSSQLTTFSATDKAMQERQQHLQERVTRLEDVLIGKAKQSFQ